MKKVEIEENLIQEILDYIWKDTIYLYGKFGGYDKTKSEESQMPEIWHKVNMLIKNK